MHKTIGGKQKKHITGIYKSIGSKIQEYSCTIIPKTTLSARMAANIIIKLEKCVSLKSLASLLFLFLSFFAPLHINTEDKNPSKPFIMSMKTMVDPTAR